MNVFIRFPNENFFSGKLSSLLLDSPQKRHRTHLIRLYELPLHHVSVKLISYLPKSTISSPLSSTDEKPLKRTHAYIAVIKTHREHKRKHASVCAPRWTEPFKTSDANQRTPLLLYLYRSKKVSSAAVLQQLNSWETFNSLENTHIFFELTKIMIGYFLSFIYCKIDGVWGAEKRPHTAEMTRCILSNLLGGHVPRLSLLPLFHF